MKKYRYTRTLTRTLLSLFCGLSLISESGANNVSITNFQYLSATQEIEFDISWDNSWRNTGTAGSTQNYDGVWVFAKYRHACAKDSVFPSASNYSHMWLSGSGHTIPAGATGELGATTIGGSARNLGIFLYRSTDGSGTFTLTDVRLKWDAAAQGISHTDWDIQLFAMEMVHIPQGSFYLGDGSSSYTFRDAGTGNPFLISSENAITLGNSAGQLSFASHANSSGTLQAGFPKGFNAFWSMKYEITQKQYCDYLNTLSRSSQAVAAPNVSAYLTNGNTNVPANNRGAFLMSSTSWANQKNMRNGIRVDGPTGTADATIDPSKPITFVCDLNDANAGNSADDGQAIACNLISIANLWRYLDWSGLRPMNELEFEKIARGPSVSPPYIQIPYETVWGNNYSVAGNSTASGNGLTNAGMANEELTATGNGLFVGGVSSPAGPRRVGITYTSSTTRLTAGSSYYGVADMAGNLDERVIAVTRNRTASAVTQPTYIFSDYGDGDPGTNYPSAWPTVSYAGTPAFTTRGGGWDVTAGSAPLAISRTYGAYSGSTSYYYQMHRRQENTNSTTNYWDEYSNAYAYYGGRGVRSQGTILP